tara:strand:- start:3393 stop:3899 length:507 start_codon:yes stop_codon:yes gene_type:complete
MGNEAFEWYPCNPNGDVVFESSFRGAIPAPGDPVRHRREMVHADEEYISSAIEYWYKKRKHPVRQFRFYCRLSYGPDGEAPPGHNDEDDNNDGDEWEDQHISYSVFHNKMVCPRRPFFVDVMRNTKYILVPRKITTYCALKADYPVPRGINKKHMTVFDSRIHLVRIY